MATRIALAGNPNCGKTTLFNSLTGSNQYVGNWPGVTVEKKEGKLKGADDVIVTDLPGIYSLSPYTSEEVISRDYLITDKPDAILNIVDATNIERNLYLTTQLLELGRPTAIALNMMDVLKKTGDTVNIEKLQDELGCVIIETSALKGTNVKKAADEALKSAKTGQAFIPKKIFSSDVEKSISDMEALLPQFISPELKRWYAIKLIERDSVVLEQLSLSESDRAKAEAISANLEKTKDDDTESIITNERYEYI
ncbi:MAG: 50S ribosome-binding GTPase, partial [Treponemataceae bacterium]|nr:50S ribosome-binding GTPase [Treponemataceae bacterium]